MVSRARGFTLVELLAVIAIIGTIISLMLPAVQAAREAVRRAACSNNLHQQGIALHSYQAAKQVFPPAYFGDRTNWYRPHWSWSAYLLPYLEQAPLYDTLGVATKDFGYGAAFAPPCAATRISLGVYVCPSDTGSRLNQRKGLHAKSNYRGIAGNQTCLVATYDTEADQNGVLYLNSALPITAITDGASNTLIVGECSLTPGGQGHVAALWAGMRGTANDAVYMSDTTWWVNSDPAVLYQRAGGSGSRQQPSGRRAIPLLRWFSSLPEAEHRGPGA